MPARDTYHYLVKKALEKDGWIITDDPLVISVEMRNVYIDLGAENLLAAEKETDKIAVEIKSFTGKSFTGEFYQAIGQFITYRGVLEKKEPNRRLYLAIPNDTYKNHFLAELVKITIANCQLKYIVYDINKEVIVRWQN